MTGHRRGDNNLDQQPLNSPEASEASLVKPSASSPVLDKPKRVKIKTSQCKIFQKPVEGAKGVQAIVVDSTETEKEPAKGVQAGSKIEIAEPRKRANQLPSSCKNTTRESLKGTQTESGKEIVNVSGKDGAPCVVLNLKSPRGSQADLKDIQKATPLKIAKRQSVKNSPASKQVAETHRKAGSNTSRSKRTDREPLKPSPAKKEPTSAKTSRGKSTERRPAKSAKAPAKITRTDRVNITTVVHSNEAAKKDEVVDLSKLNRNDVRIF